MVRWLDVNVGDVGEMGVALGDPEEVSQMQDYTMPDGRKEKVKVAAGKREKTDRFNLITAEIGMEDEEKSLLSLITAFPGGSTIEGKEIPPDRSKFAEEGFYFVVPETSPVLKSEDLEEAIVDTVSDRLSDVFDDNGIMKPEVDGVIKKGIETIQKQFPNLEISLIILWWELLLLISIKINPI